MSTPVQVFVRDTNFNLLGQIEDFQQLVVTMKYNDVGTWELTVPADSTGAALLDRAANPGGGIIVMRNGVQLMSGPARGHKWSRSGETGNGVMTVVGLDDAWILSAHLVWPDPLHAIDAQANYWWSTATSNAEISRPAETIMYTLAAAQLLPNPLNGRGGPANLTFGANHGRGLSQLVPKTWRFNTVLDALQQMSTLSQTGGDPKTELGFSVDQAGLYQTSQTFTVFQSNDRSSTVRFSFNLGNLAEAEYNTTAPQATYLISGAGQIPDPTASSSSTTSGTNVNKTLFGWSRADTYYPNFYAEGFMDASEIDPLDTNAVAQLTQQVNDFWSANGGQVAATIKAVDTATMAFGTDYMLGDFVTVELPQLTFVERVRQVGLTCTPDNGEELVLAIGTADGAYARLTPGRTNYAMFQKYVAAAKAKYAAQQAEAHRLHVLHLQTLHNLHVLHLKTLANQKKRVQPSSSKPKKK